MIKNLIIVGLVTLNLAFGYALYTQTTTTDPAVLQRKASSLKPAGAASSQHGQDGVTVATGAASTTQFDGPYQNVAEGSYQNLAEGSYQNLAEGSYQNLAAELRQQGMDEDMVRQLVYASLKRDQINNRVATPEDYWRNPDRSRTDKNQELQQLAEQRLTLIGIFGDEIADDPMFEDLFKPLNERMPFLSSEKQIALYEQGQRRMIQSMEMGRFGRQLQESSEDYQQMREDQDAFLAQLLTPDELFEYQLRNDPGAWRLRSFQEDFIQSEQEFRDLFRIQQDVVGDGPVRRPTENAELNQRIRDYLGDTRFEEYQRNQDMRYRMIQAIGERYNDSNAEVIAVYNAVTAGRQEIESLGQGTLRQADRAERATEILDDVAEKVSRIAGSNTADSIRENSRRLGLTIGGGRQRGFPNR